MKENEMLELLADVGPAGEALFREWLLLQWAIFGASVLMVIVMGFGAWKLMKWLIDQ